jgi:hypothetical protein
MNWWGWNKVLSVAVEEHVEAQTEFGSNCKHAMWTVFART